MGQDRSAGGRPCQAAAAAESGALGPGHRAPPVVLVACADADARDICDACLRHFGFAVHVAESGDAAFALACTVSPDVIVTSYPTYSPDGVPVTTRIRQHDSLRRVPVLSLASWVRREDLRTAEAAGVTVSLTMPVTLEALVSAVRRLAGAGHVERTVRPATI